LIDSPMNRTSNAGGAGGNANSARFMSITFMLFTCLSAVEIAIIILILVKSNEWHGTHKLMTLTAAAGCIPFAMKFWCRFVAYQIFTTIFGSIETNKERQWKKWGTISYLVNSAMFFAGALSRAFETPQYDAMSTYWYIAFTALGIFVVIPGPYIMIVYVRSLGDRMNQNNMAVRTKISSQALEQNTKNTTPGVWRIALVSALHLGCALIAVFVLDVWSNLFLIASSGTYYWELREYLRTFGRRGFQSRGKQIRVRPISAGKATGSTENLSGRSNMVSAVRDDPELPKVQEES